MKKIIFALFLFFVAFDLPAQYVLTTPDGKKVQLNTNGTWQYVKDDRPGNGAGIFVPKASTSKYVSRFNKYTIWFDPAEWVCDSSSKDDIKGWEAEFTSKDEALSGYFTASRLSMSIQNLEETVRDQWKESGDIKSFTTFKDTINNLPVTGFDMMLETGGIMYQYRGYVHTTLKGSFQFTVGTQKEVFEEDEDKIDLLFRGVVINQ